MNIPGLLEWLDGIAPFQTAESFDNVGLIIGDRNAEVTGICFGLDVSEDLLCDAIRAGANTVITHHPFLFHPVKRIDSTSPMAACLQLIFSHHLNIIAMHTNWDSAPGGVSDELARVLTLQDVRSVDRYLRIGSLPCAMTAEAFIVFVGDVLRISPKLYGDPSRRIETVAVAGGAYGEAALFAADHRADALLTGEIKHHEILEGVSRGLILISAEHYATEFPGLLALASRFSEAFPEVPVFKYDTAPFPGAIQVYRRNS